MSEEKLTRDERSLLLYLETCCVDGRGRVKAISINVDDISTIREWNASGYIVCMELKEELRPGCYVDAVTLSDEALTDAHALRKDRILRNLPKPDTLTAAGIKVLERFNPERK